MTQADQPYLKNATGCRNPATGDILGYSPLTPTDSLPAIISGARTAQKMWAELPVKNRMQFIRRILNDIVEYADDISVTISRDNGKTRADALITEVLPSALAVSYWIKHAAKQLKPRRLGSGTVLFANKRSRIARIPYGVIGIISPWNYPFAIPFSEVLMAILAGNTVILKTATETQMVGRRLEKCFSTAGLPEGIFNYVNMPGQQAGNALLAGGIDKLFFTGSVTIGKQLMREAGKTLTPVVLELGGNDAMLVCADADLRRAAAGAVWAGLQNCGQSCAGVERIYVHEYIYDEFLDILKDLVGALRLDFSENPDVDLGVMTTEKQMSTVMHHINDALAKGAVIHARSKYPTGKDLKNSFPATVLTEVHHGMLVMQEETFGPVLAVMKVADMNEAVILANDTSYALTGSVWSKNKRNAARLAKRINAGVVMINDHLTAHGMPEVPWGGSGHSGFGRTHGSIGFDEMTRPRVIIDDILPFTRKNICWYPHDRKLYEGLLGIIRCLYGKEPRTRVRGLWNLLKIIPRFFSTK